jgi:hypothetical protein
VCMKRVFLTAVIILGLLSGASSQQTLVVPSGKSVWFTSAPGAPDLLDMVTRSDEPRYNWDSVRPLISVFQYYQGHAVPYKWDNAEGNSYNILSRGGFFRSLKETHRFETAMEVGAVKWFACDDRKGEVYQMAKNAVESTVMVYEAGGNLGHMTIDSALVGGYTCHEKVLYPNDTGTLVAVWMRDVRLMLAEKRVSSSPLQIGDVEPYPYIDLDKHKMYVDMVERESKRLGIPGLSHYHFDVDMRALRDYPRLHRDMSEMSAYLKARGIRFGVIMNGEDSSTAIQYFETLNKRLVVFKSLGIFDLVQNIVIQSWAMSPDGKQNLPSNVPESDPYTHTNFAWHMLNCISDTPGWDCERYPVPK